MRREKRGGERGGERREGYSEERHGRVRVRRREKGGL